MDNRPDLDNTLADLLSATLPASWQAVVRPGPEPGPDALITLTDPTGRRSRFLVEIKARVEPRDVETILKQVRPWASPSDHAVVVAPFLSARTRALLRDLGASYIDYSGNIRLVADNHGLFISHSGSEKNPFPEERSRRSLRGPVTGRVVRFLCDVRPPYGVRDIAERTNVNPGNVSKLLDFLNREKLVERDSNGVVVSNDWYGILQRWAPDVARDRIDFKFFASRGPEYLGRQLQNTSISYSITGSFGASQLAPTAYATSIDLYGDHRELSKSLRLQNTYDVANVRIIKPFDEVVFERTMTKNRLVMACPSQIVADLFTLPRRSKEEIDALVTWMRDNERLWRLG